MSDLLQMARDVLASQPFSALMGAELTEFKEGSAALSLTVRDEFRQQHGYVHGGVLSYLADNCLTFAGGSVLGDCVTAEFKLNYVRPATDDRLVARATVLSTGRRQAVCECKIFAGSEAKPVLVAAAQGTISKVEQS